MFEKIEKYNDQLDLNDEQITPYKDKYIGTRF